LSFRVQRCGHCIYKDFVSKELSVIIYCSLQGFRTKVSLLKTLRPLFVICKSYVNCFWLLYLFIYLQGRGHQNNPVRPRNHCKAGSQSCSIFLNCFGSCFFLTVQRHFSFLFLNCSSNFRDERGNFIMLISFPEGLMSTVLNSVT